ncbi:MAG: tRNA (adenosine(37)-N6)-threonylcarbamoyltransferase complex dimerization subunit type 1 TsaB [Melioribacteraceae bacterium]|nr:tRNA (adenosine(37)-N6)-threonylcarbamoyltransferase complex dimerization subunit type 1 TsaB [Melioribacteraceae bacterium]MCF8355382.1 tRNA (adenosine(37)-N6)-threonylcarbamoyltransferase complex dimerization subunit type 1 TsaB [Melioribacteraceae bacterium]MCF8394627.1 tRNA (adenosine(37)-N6)-threonylcarbamoyltransferase complex dimerization subunit type 1 TsaB [Melioribacteraceae bacterium]MCF8419624.1 tRNA (adenosine(37)-N6)-threonylcarbamoyltransferase complex dimerization subunit type
MADLKKILAVETSGNLCSTALMLNEKDFLEYNIHKKHIHSQKLLSCIENLLKDANMSLEELDALAVSSGPGSFTGLRIGMAAVKGLALGAGLPIIPVPTFDAFAFEISYYLTEGSRFAIANKVNVDEVYFASYIKSGESFSCTEELKLIEAETIDERFSLKYDSVYGDAVKNNMRNISSPRAVSVGRWSYIFGKDLLTYNFDYLEPNYLKKFIVKV